MTTIAPTARREGHHRDYLASRAELDGGRELHRGRREEVARFIRGEGQAAHRDGHALRALAEEVEHGARHAEGVAGRAILPGGHEPRRTVRCPRTATAARKAGKNQARYHGEMATGPVTPHRSPEWKVSQALARAAGHSTCTRLASSLQEEAARPSREGNAHRRLRHTAKRCS